MKRSNNIFWISFADIMTALFFIVLVMYALTYVNLKKNQQKLEVKLERLERILQLEKQFEPLIESPSFTYLPDCKKFIAKELMGVEIFEPNKAIIKPALVPKALAVGETLQTFLGKLYQTNKSFDYLVIIEGNMANRYDHSISKESPVGFSKSYERALAVYQLWVSEGIDLRKYNAEVIICGSGFNGLCRDAIEDNNKRFSIQIIPKVSFKR